MIDFEAFKANSPWSQMSPPDKLAYIEHINKEGSPAEKAALAFDWINTWSRPEQVPFMYADIQKWDTWLFVAGRGCGKTKAGAELVRHLVFELFPRFPLRIGCVTPKFSDIEAVVALGDSGVMNCLAPWEREKSRFYSTSRKIVFNEGTDYASEVRFYSSDDPENLRGSQFHMVWLDEVAAYPNPDGVLLQVAMCLRLKLPNGISAKKFITTTPKPYQWLRDMVKEARTDDRILVTRGSTYDNAANLSDTMFREIAKFEGTQIGTQEIYGEILSGDSAGIIKKSWLRKWPKDEALPKLRYVFTSYDPAFTEKTSNDPTGCVVVGVFKDIDNEYSAILLDAWAEHLSYPDLKAQVIADWENRYGEGDRLKRPDGAIIEVKGGGNALIPDLRNTKVKIIKYNPGRSDKIERLHSVSWFIKEGKFYIPESRKAPGEFVSYLENFVEELTNFPLVKHDDMVDALTQLLILLNNGGLFEGITTDRDDDDYDEDEDERYYTNPSTNPYAM